MALLPVMSIAGAIAALNALTALVTSSATIKLYSGAQPATTLTARSGTLLSTMTMGSTPIATPSTGGHGNGLATAVANTITSDTNAAATGIAGYFSVATTTPLTIMQGNVGTSGCDMNLNTTSIQAGDTVACTSFTITLPCGDGSS